MVGRRRVEEPWKDENGVGDAATEDGRRGGGFERVVEDTRQVGEHRAAVADVICQDEVAHGPCAGGSGPGGSG